MKNKNATSLPVEACTRSIAEMFDTTDSKSLYNMVPDIVRNFMVNIPKEYFYKSEDSFRKEIEPSKVEIALRRGFWREYNQSLMSCTNMQLTRIHKGICNRTTAILHFSNLKFLSWVLASPMDDINNLEAIYEKSLENLEQIMTMDLTDVKGGVDTKKAQVFLSAFKAVEDRVKGGVINRSENKNLTVKIEERVMEERDKRIENLKKKLGLDYIPTKSITVSQEENKDEVLVEEEPE
ncbi:MAG: hypothetical protein EHM34_02620 [Nitrosopumilales archaeon]|nr:MAG: hypothetical protein EHM34_02620 [Nitrosopumilales archaeon]